MCTRDNKAAYRRSQGVLRRSCFANKESEPEAGIPKLLVAHTITYRVMQLPSQNHHQSGKESPNLGSMNVPSPLIRLGKGCLSGEGGR